MSSPKLDPVLQDVIKKIRSVCAESQRRTQYFPYGGTGYKTSVMHYFESSTEVAAGAVQPGSEEDLVKIVKIIADAGVKFAVKCGGHSTNPKFSSTTGIQICLSRFNQIDIDVPKKLVRVGAGCLFGELYQALEPHELGIVGGSGLSGVGVSGWMLGGGYSVKTSQFGLGVDNLESARVLLPKGTIAVASEKENRNLFFAIKGGGNNYGIVTEFTLRAHAQPKNSFFDELFVFRDPREFERVKQIIYKIIKMQDNRVNIEAAFRHHSQPGQLHPEVTLTVHGVYDGSCLVSPFLELVESTPPGDNGPVAASEHYKTNDFLVAEHRHSYYNGTYDVMSPPAYSDPVTISDIPGALPPMSGIGQFPRGRWGNVMVDEFTPRIIDKIQEQAEKVAQGLGQHGGTRAAIGLWPFTRTMFDNATDAAFPHEKGKPNCPIIVYFTWEGEKNDKYWIDTMKATLEELKKTVLEERPESKHLPYFINTAFAEATTVKDLYRNNLPRLQQLRKEYDPKGLMDSTGGFRIQPA